MKYQTGDTVRALYSLSATIQRGDLVKIVERKKYGNRRMYTVEKGGEITAFVIEGALAAI